MADQPAIADAPTQAPPDRAPGSLSPPSLPPAPPVFCVKCSADLTPLPPVARFCNRCGSALPARLHHAPTEPPQPPQLPQPPAPSPFRPPEILIAYAKALFNLGCRYETALGSRRNLEEAARCYWKAARLSHAAAHARADPDAPPPFASVHRSYLP